MQNRQVTKNQGALLYKFKMRRVYHKVSRKKELRVLLNELVGGQIGGLVITHKNKKLLENLQGAVNAASTQNRVKAK